MGKLDGRVAIITGGARGLGSATAELFAREGAKKFVSKIASSSRIQKYFT